MSIKKPINFYFNKPENNELSCCQMMNNLNNSKNNYITFIYSNWVSQVIDSEFGKFGELGWLPREATMWWGDGRRWLWGEKE